MHGLVAGMRFGLVCVSEVGTRCPLALARSISTQTTILPKSKRKQKQTVRETGHKPALRVCMFNMRHLLPACLPSHSL